MHTAMQAHVTHIHLTRHSSCYLCHGAQSQLLFCYQGTAACTACRRRRSQQMLVAYVCSRRKPFTPDISHIACGTRPAGEMGSVAPTQLCMQAPATSLVRLGYVCTMQLVHPTSRHGVACVPLLLRGYYCMCTSAS